MVGSHINPQIMKEQCDYLIYELGEQPFELGLPMEILLRKIH
jgi:hypothetical protein